MERNIRVTGKGTLAVRPDTIRLRITLQETLNEYNTALAASSAMTEELKGTIDRLGFCRDDLKTVSFRIEANYESFQDPAAKSWHQRFAGYTFEHHLKLEFPDERKRLGEVLYALAHTEARPEIFMEYTVADPQSVKNELLKKAVQDSLGKARLLTAAAGVQLGALQTIDYSWGEIEMVSRPLDQTLAMDAVCTKACSSYQMDLTPDDIHVDDTVTVTWQITD